MHSFRTGNYGGNVSYSSPHGPNYEAHLSFEQNLMKLRDLFEGFTIVEEKMRGRMRDIYSMVRNEQNEQEKKVFFSA